MQTSNNPTQQIRDLILRANSLFPLAPYLQAQSVRGARRRWIRAVLHLREIGALRQDEFVRRINAKAAKAAASAAQAMPMAAH